MLRLASRLALICALALARTAGAAVGAGPIVNPANGHAYYLLTPTSWADAEAEAQTLGGHLVAIGDADENAWVWETFAEIAGGPFWIGLSDAAQEGVFTWTNGEPFSYSSWWVEGGEPNNAGGVEHYVELNNYVWNDNDGGGPFRAVVEVATTGELAFVESVAIPPPPPSAFESASIYELAIPRDGGHVYALYDVAIGTDKILVYERAASDGALTLIAEPQTTANPNGMALAPDGRALFVTGNNGEVQAWRRDPATGLLTIADQVFDGNEGADSIGFAYGVAVSPDGAHVYVASGENAVTSFAWNDASGQLTVIDTDLTGEGGLVLSGPFRVAITPDGAFLLVESSADQALVVFARNAATGALAFAQRFVNGEGGVTGISTIADFATARAGSGASIEVLSGAGVRLARFVEIPGSPSPSISFVESIPFGGFPTSLAISSDGTRLYASDLSFDDVVAYERDPQTGVLGASVGQVAASDPGVSGLTDPNHVTPSWDGRNVYVASSANDRIVVLASATPEPDALALGLAALATVAAHARRRTR